MSGRQLPQIEQLVILAAAARRLVLVDHLGRGGQVRMMFFLTEHDAIVPLEHTLQRMPHGISHHPRRLLQASPSSLAPIAALGASGTTLRA